VTDIAVMGDYVLLASESEGMGNEADSVRVIDAAGQRTSKSILYQKNTVKTGKNILAEMTLFKNWIAR
jgi:hypothetical protein